jgi:hypothetical protein
LGGLRAALFFASKTGGVVRISYSKYTAFLKNPERFRLYYMLGLTPEGDETPTLMNYGRRRGSCFHAMNEGIDRGLLLAKYGKEVVSRCEDMLEVVPDLGELDWVEREFEIPIGDGKHSINGRIDHRFVNRDGVRQPGDFKTTKGTRTKAEVRTYFGDLETSTQSHFYLRAEREWTETPTGLFTYHVIFDRKDKDHKPTYAPVELYVGPAEVDRTMAEVYAACEAIEFLQHTYGVEKPWPHSNNWPCSGDRSFCGYQEICGRMMPKGCVPPGFTSRYKEQIQADTGDGQ